MWSKLQKKQDKGGLSKEDYEAERPVHLLMKMMELITYTDEVEEVFWLINNSTLLYRGFPRGLYDGRMDNEHIGVLVERDRKSLTMNNVWYTNSWHSIWYGIRFKTKHATKFFKILQKFEVFLHIVTQTIYLCYLQTKNLQTC